MSKPRERRSWPKTMPRWLRGIVMERSKLLGKTLNHAKVHEELLDIHRPVISREMVKHPKWILFVVAKDMKKIGWTPAKGWDS